MTPNEGRPGEGEEEAGPPGGPPPRPSDPGESRDSDELDLGDSRADELPEDLTESSALVFMSESDVSRLDEPEAPEPPPRTTGKPPRPRVVPPRAPDRRADTAPAPRSKAPAILTALAALGISAGAVFAVYEVEEWGREADRAASSKELDQAREEGRAAVARTRAKDAELASKEAEVRRLGDELAAVRRASDEGQRNMAAERKKVEEDFEAAEAAQRSAMRADRDAEVAATEKRERERAERERLDIERRGREAIDRFQGLLAETEKQKNAELEVLRKEARAEILRREAAARKELEEQTKRLSAEKEKAVELEARKLEAKLRSEIEAEKGGLIHGGGGGEEPAEGLDLETAVWEHLKGHVGGSAEYRLFDHWYLSDQPQAKQVRDEGVFKLRYDLKAWDQLELLLVPRVRIDDNGYAHGIQDTFEERQVHRPIFTFEEAWLRASLGNADLKVGKQVFAIGTGDIANPTDVLNPVDYSDLIDSEKIGVPAADLSYAIGDSAALRVIAIPTFTPSRFPLPGRRFSLLPPQGIFLETPLGPLGPLAMSDPEYPARTPQNAQLMGRATTSAFGFDLSGTYFTGFNRLPNIDVVPTPNPLNPVLLIPRFDRFHMFGADFSTTVKDFELHGEAAQFLTEGQRDDDYGQYVAGGRYTRGAVVSSQDELRLHLEYMGQWVTEHRTADNVIPAAGLTRVFGNAVLARASYKPFDRFEVQGTVVWLVERPRNVYVRPEASYELGAHTKIRAGCDLFSGHSDTFFGQFREDDRFWATVKLSF